MSRTALSLLASVLFVVLTGCSNPVKVIRQAEPNPFDKSTEFVVTPTSFVNLKVNEGQEADYIKSQGQEFEKTWNAEKAFMSREFMSSVRENAVGVRVFAADPRPNMILLRANIFSIEVGDTTGKASKVVMTLIIARGNSTLDEVRIESSTKPEGDNATLTRRLRTDARKLGLLAAQYLKKRLGV